MIKYLRERYAYKEDLYPRDLQGAYELLNHHVVANKIPEVKTGGTKWKGKQQPEEQVLKGAQYAQDNEEIEKPTAGTDGKVHQVTCYNCNKFGHYAGNCPEKKKANTEEETHHAEEVMLQSDEESDGESVILSFCNHLSEVKKYSNTDILLDTGSTVSVFNNRKMLTDIKTTPNTMRALTNGGFQDSNMRGILPGFFPVWFNSESRLNILAWKDVREKFCITADTGAANEIVVHVRKRRQEDDLQRSRIWPVFV